MKRKIFIASLVIVVLGVIFCLAFRPRLLFPPSRQDVIQGVFENPQVFGVVDSAQEVTVQRLHLKEGGDGDLLSSYEMDAPVPISADAVQKIKTLLESPSSYLWGVGSMCIPDYGILFNFRSGGRTVRVAFCFKCNWVSVYDGIDDNAREVNGVDLFVPMRQSMVEICKAIFPNDKEIQSLK